MLHNHKAKDWGLVVALWLCACECARASGSGFHPSSHTNIPERSICAECKQLWWKLEMIDRSGLSALSLQHEEHRRDHKHAHATPHPAQLRRSRSEVTPVSSSSSTKTETNPECAPEPGASSSCWEVRTSVAMTTIQMVCPGKYLSSSWRSSRRMIPAGGYVHMYEIALEGGVKRSSLAGTRKSWCLNPGAAPGHQAWVALEVWPPGSWGVFVVFVCLCSINMAVLRCALGVNFILIDLKSLSDSTKRRSIIDSAQTEAETCCFWHFSQFSTLPTFPLPHLTVKDPRNIFSQMAIILLLFHQNLEIWGFPFRVAQNRKKCVFRK